MNEVHARTGHATGFEQFLADMTHGTHPILIVDGAAGLGKSTTVASLADTARQRGADVRIAEADDEDFGSVRSQLEAAGRAAGGPPAPEAGRTGRLLVVDDAHRADAASLTWISAQLADPASTQVACVLTIRRGEPLRAPHEIERLRRALHSRTVSLRPLGPAGVSRLVARSFGITADTSFDRACYRATRGVPLLVVELLGALHAVGATPDAAGVAQVAEASSPMMAAAVNRLLERVHPLATTAAAALAVLNRPVTPAQLAAVCEVSKNVAGDLLAATASAQVTDARDGRFFHPFVRQSLYRAIPRPERERWHDAAAHLLRHDADLEDVVRHVERGSRALDPRTAAVSTSVAGRCRSAGLRDLAVTCLSAAVEQVTSPTRRSTLELDLARLLARRRGERARAVAGQVLLSTSPAERAAASALLAYLLARDDGVAAVDAGSRGARTAQLAAVDALVALPGADPAAAIVLARAGRDRAAAVTAAIDDLDDEPSLEGPPPRTVAAVLTLIDADRLDEADAALEVWAAAAPEDVDVGALRARCQLRRGQVAAAARTAEQVLEHLNRGAAPPLGHSWSLVLAEAALETTAPTPRQLADESAAADSVSRLEHRLARIVAGQPDTTMGIQQLFDVGSDGARAGLANPRSLPWRAHALRLMHLAGGHPQAIELARDNVRAARDWGAPSLIGDALLLQSSVVEAADRGRLLAEAWECAAEGPDELLRARLRLVRGSQHSAADESAQARALLGEALDEAGRLGARRTADLAFRAVQQAGGRPRRRRQTGVDGLTDRELDIAQRAASGSTNRDIAEELYLTQRTVELHLTKAFRKLGISRRSELARHLDAP